MFVYMLTRMTSEMGKFDDVCIFIHHIVPFVPSSLIQLVVFNKLSCE